MKFSKLSDRHVVDALVHGSGYERIAGNECSATTSWTSQAPADPRTAAGGAPHSTRAGPALVRGPPHLYRRRADGPSGRPVMLCQTVTSVCRVRRMWSADAMTASSAPRAAYNPKTDSDWLRAWPEK